MVLACPLFSANPAIFVTIAMVKVELIPEFYTGTILLTNESGEIGEKQLSIFWLQRGPN